MKLRRIFLSIFLTFFAGFSVFAIPSVSGKLLQSNGKALAYTEIELVSLGAVEETRVLAISDAFGRFEFIKIPSGNYTLSINFNEKPTEMSPFSTIFYPTTEVRSQAQVFPISENSRFTSLIFRLTPKLIERAITGKVVWSNGDPVSDAFIYINDAAYDDTFGLTDLRTGSDGRFSIKAFENRSYQVGAVLFEKSGKTLLEAVGPIMASARSQVFLLNAETKRITLTLEEPEETKRRRRNVGKILHPQDNYVRIAKK